MTTPLARNVRRIGHLDLPGGGQVVVQGNHAIVGHMKPVTRPQERHGPPADRLSSLRS